ncbi:hypothetical protein EJV47_03645 [Hymenobacter gummosus]|uniref:DUF3823 domain-containing protein n=1 Tax=Hymenobacter gummosus TaxID=1776032 RepID=A0A431U735_9BACT|nr:hypothetical protein [Hymenobacter gummosus]RTQ52131.1 hypothetical protein EJV47_03645 [Hymenobacter gummosus]
MLRIRLLLAALATAALQLTTACVEAPEYPDEPSIEFDDIKVERVDAPAPATDYNRIFITVKYKDGDNDLGLSDADRQTAPFNDPNSEYRFNYYLKVFYFDQWLNEFREYSFGSFNYNGVFDRLPTGSDKPQPIRGDLKYEPAKGLGFDVNTPPFRTGSRVKFEVQIVDRKLHKSNAVMTREVVMP